MPSVYIPLHIHKTSLGISDKSVSLKLQFNTFIKKINIFKKTRWGGAGPILATSKKQKLNK